MATTAFSYRLRNSSDSDSGDSDNESRDWKRASRKETRTDFETIPTEQPPVANPVPAAPVDNAAASKRKRRNNIWSDVLQDQMMSETLGHCGIKNKPKGYGSRGEESYDYTLKYKFAKMSDGSRRMSEDELSDASETNSVASSNDNQFRSSKFVKLDPAGVAAAKKIITALAEQKRYLIFRVVKYIGIEKAMKLLKMTEDVEENGGMLIKNQGRRRTPGGVYLQLLKSEKDIEQEVIDKIFEGELTSWEQKKLLDRKRKEKKKLLKDQKDKHKILKGMQVSQSKPETEVDDEVMAMEAEEVLPVENTPVASVIQTSKDSDPEDGEIED